MLPGNTPLTPLSGPRSPLRSAVLSLVLLGFVFWPRVGWTQDDGNIDILRRMGDAFASVAQKASPGVVGIVARRNVAKAVSPTQESPYGDQVDPFSEEFFEYFFRRSPQDQTPRRDYTQRAQGSGFIISKEGHILTNNHLVGDADEVSVELANGRTVKAKIVGADPESDVAVIQVDAPDLTPVPLGDSDKLRVGEWVLAIGNPMGLSHTVTAGIVSATGRSGLNIATYENFIQTDAAINLGNSGGPLVNLNAQAVGINTAILGPGGGNIGIGFAIPINMARQVADQLIKTGTVERGYLGVVPQDLTEDLAKAFDVDEGKGAVLSQVTEGSAAARAGLQAGDVVLEFRGIPIESASQFRNLVAGGRPGEKVDMVILRKGQRMTITATLDTRPSAEQLQQGQQRRQRPSEEGQEPQQLGLTVRDLTPELAQKFGYEQEEGVIITRVTPGSEAAEKGLRAGYVIREVNRKTVSNVEQFRKAVTQAIDGNQSVLLLITNGQVSQYVVLNGPKE
ncbi:MAG: Do family serine endopeptidase [Solirubrobacterales bacterium]